MNIDKTMKDKLNFVLMVDDDEYTTNLYEMIISWTPYTNYFLTVPTANEAIKELKKREKRENNFPRYILLDLNMPEMNGFEFLDFFKENFSNHVDDTKIIIATSSIREKDKEKALEYPFVEGFEIKPLSENLVEKLITG